MIKGYGLYINRYKNNSNCPIAENKVQMFRGGGEGKKRHCSKKLFTKVCGSLGYARKLKALRTDRNKRSGILWKLANLLHSFSHSCFVGYYYAALQRKYDAYGTRNAELRTVSSCVLHGMCCSIQTCMKEYFCFILLKIHLVAISRHIFQHKQNYCDVQ